MKATDIRVETVEVTFDDERLSVPLHLSKGVIEAITYAAVTVNARTRGGSNVQGTGAILLSAASIVSKMITPGAISPIGIITSLVGVPFFLSLILAKRRQRWS